MAERDASHEMESMVGQLQVSVSAMSNMIDDLLNLSRSTSSQLQLGRLDLSAMANTIFEALVKSDPDRQVRIHVHPNCETQADPGLAQIVMENLLRNAWKFTGKRAVAEIEFGCQGRPDNPVFYVRDNGAGFNPQLVERLFKPFQRLHGGVRISRHRDRIGDSAPDYRRHGGKVWAEGDLDKGATFYFTFGSTQK